MKKLFILCLMTLGLTGCSSNVTYESYMREYVEVNHIELNSEILNMQQTQLSYTERITKLTYYEYYEDYDFKPITIYAFCINEECDIINEIEYNQFKE